MDPYEEKQEKINPPLLLDMTPTKRHTEKLHSLSHGILKDTHSDAEKRAAAEARTDGEKAFKDKTAITQWTLNQFVINSLDPSVTAAETEEYSRYIRHHLDIPLVVSSDVTEAQSLEYHNYVRNGQPDVAMHTHTNAEQIDDFMDFLKVEEEPLKVVEEDLLKKRYKRYRQWLKGKSLFKQSKVDPQAA